MSYEGLYYLILAPPSENDYIVHVSFRPMNLDVDILPKAAGSICFSYSLSAPKKENRISTFTNQTPPQNVLVANRLAAFFASTLSSSSSSLTPFELPAPLPTLFLPSCPVLSPSSGTGEKLPLMLLSNASDVLGTPLHASPLGPWLDDIVVLRIGGWDSLPNLLSPPDASMLRTSGRTLSNMARVRRSASISRRTYSRMLVLRSAAVRGNHFRFSCRRFAVTLCVLLPR